MRETFANDVLYPRLQMQESGQVLVLDRVEYARGNVNALDQIINFESYLKAIPDTVSEEKK